MPPAAAKLADVDRVLAQLLSDRFTADRSLTEEVRHLVVGAFRGPEELEAVLGGAEPEELLPGPAGPASEPAGAYLGSVTVEGFRGIGPATRLEIQAGPGLTLVVGRNGSGKSQPGGGPRSPADGRQPPLGRPVASMERGLAQPAPFGLDPRRGGVPRGGLPASHDRDPHVARRGDKFADGTAKRRAWRHLAGRF